MLTKEQILAATLETDQRLAKTKAPTSQKRLPKSPKVLRTGSPTEPYDLVSGKALKQPNRKKLENRLRKAEKATRSTGRYEDALELSRALDQAELWDLKIPLVGLCIETLHQWELNQL